MPFPHPAAYLWVMIDIKDISGSILKSVPITLECKSYEEVMALCYITLSWEEDDNTQLPAGAYIEHGGKTYRLIEPYDPAYVNEASWRYTPKFYDKIALWSKKPLFLVTDTGEETDWSLTAYPGQFMEAVVAAILEYTGETYTYSVDASIAQLSMKNVTFQNTSIFDGLTKIANAWDTEWWVSGNVIHLSKCQYGTAVTLTVGDNVGIPSVTKNKEGYFTRFYAFGGTRNITQDYNDSGFTNGLVNKRLTLDPTDYPGGYIDIKPNLQQAEIFVKTLIFNEIYPSSSLTISNVRAELKDLLDESGNKIQVAEDAEGNPVYQQYSIWYFKIPGFTLDNSTYDKEDNPDGMLLPGLALSVSFESGQLNGRDFELTYHGDTQEYEINFIKEGTLIVPGTVSLIPADGDKIILYNIKMPDEYKSSAQDDLAEALLSEIEKYKQDRDSYTFPSASDKFEEDGLDMSVGQAVTFVHGDKSLPSRVLKVEKQLDFPIEQTITVGEEKIKGNTQEIKEEVIDANQNIDVVKTLADLNKAITDGYGRVQQLIIQSMSQYKGMWVLNQNGHPDDPSYWTVETDYTAISRGDIVAKSVDEEIEDAELPKAGYGITNFGLTAIKQGGGLMIDSNNLVYVDPAYAGGGGIDTGELEQYLTSHHYMKRNDPASYLLMTGYAMPETYAPVTSTDTVLTAIGKLERNFGNYVTIATQQTVTGKKTFTQDIIGQGDIIAKSTSEAISDAELPIASATQLGLIKVGTGFEITADGVLNNTGTGGLTEVYWSDVMNKPTTLAGYGITDALGKNETAVAASKLSPGCKIWGQAFTGESDVSGSLSGVGNITGNGSIDIITYSGTARIALKLGNDDSRSIVLVDNEFRPYPAGNGLISLGINSVRWKDLWLSGNAYINGNIAAGTSSPQAKLHVVGNGLFTDAIDISPDNKSHRLNLYCSTTYAQIQSYGSIPLRINTAGNTIITGANINSNTSSLILGVSEDDPTVAVTSLAFYTTSAKNGLVNLGSSSNKFKNLYLAGDAIVDGDVIAKSTSSAISDAELPIASKTQLGLIKIGTGFEITADGTLNNTGSGGLTEVFWTDIKNTPTTLAGYGIKASDVLTTLKTVDGSGSGIDADLLDGTQKTALLTSVTSTSGNNLSVVVGGTTKSVSHLFATNFTPTSIPENANLNSYNIPGMYYCPMNATVATLDNSPTNQAFSLLVERHAGYKQTLSEYITSTAAKTWTRNFYNGAWGPWRQLAYTTDNVASATKLQTARTINGTSFNGTANITTAKWGTARNIYIRDASQAHTGAAVSVDGSANEYLLLPSTITASLSGNATTATRLQTARTIWGNSFNGSDNIGGTLTPLADNTYDLGTTSRRWRYLYFYGYNGNWVSGKTRAAINIESQNSSTSTYFPYLRIESKYGDVFNIGMLQSSSEAANQFGIFRFASDRTANGTDSSFYMRGDGNMYGTGTLTMNGDIIAKSTSSAISDSELPIASASTLGLIKVGSGLKITNGVLSATGGGVQGETGPQGQGVTYRWSGTSLQLGTIPVGGGVTTWGSPVNLKGDKGDRGATGPQGPKGDDGRDGTLSASTICYLPSAGTIFTTDNKLGVKLSGGNGIVGTNNGIRGNLYFNYVSSVKYVLVDGNANLTCKGTIFYANLSQDSDLRLKHVLGELNGVLDIMSQIPVIEYQYKADEDKINYYGFGAQSFIGRFRNIATLNNDHYTINTSGIVAIAFQGVKELYGLQKQTTNEIDALKRRIALLEAENQNLWNLLNDKEAA